MRNQTAITILGLLLISCSSGMTEHSLIEKLSNVKDWSIAMKTNSIDTTNRQRWLPEPSIELVLTNLADSTCPTPRLAQYPIELRSYIEKKLMNYLILRATLFPPPPHKYTTDGYFVLGWNFEGDKLRKYCNCNELENILVADLELKPQKPTRGMRRFH